jgi:hypothetical protein
VSGTSALLSHRTEQRHTVHHKQHMSMGTMLPDIGADNSSRASRADQSTPRLRAERGAAFCQHCCPQHCCATKEGRGAVHYARGYDIKIMYITAPALRLGDWESECQTHLQLVYNETAIAPINSAPGTASPGCSPENEAAAQPCLHRWPHRQLAGSRFRLITKPGSTGTCARRQPPPPPAPLAPPHTCCSCASTKRLASRCPQPDPAWQLCNNARTCNASCRFKDL